MNEPKKWQKEIVAWAGGAEIEVRGPKSARFGDGFGPWVTEPSPACMGSYEYRIKPERKVIRYRVALIRWSDDQEPGFVPQAVVTDARALQVCEDERLALRITVWNEPSSG